MPLSDRTLRLGADVASALLGLDALYRKESKDGSGLVVVNMDEDGLLTAEGFGGYGDAAERFADLGREAAELPEPDRRTYYTQACSSSRAFIRWRAEGSTFEDQLGSFLHVPVQPASGAEIEEIERALRSLLGTMGFDGDLGSQCGAWEERGRVAPEDVPRAFDRLMDEAWDRTCEHVVQIPAERDDGMKARAVSGVPYNARCDYLRRTVEINTDPALTLSGLRHLAVHEGVPGHYLQFKLRQTGARRGTSAADVLLSVVNTASSSTFEGIADTAMAMIGWDASDDDRVQALLNRHRAAIGTVAAWRLHSLGSPGNRVADWLRSHALVGGEGWVRNRMAFIEAPERAVLIWSYWWGERVVAPVWRAMSADRRGALVDFLYGRMHSNASVEMFR